MDGGNGEGHRRQTDAVGDALRGSGAGISPADPLPPKRCSRRHALHFLNRGDPASTFFRRLA